VGGLAVLDPFFEMMEENLDALKVGRKRG